MDKIEKAELLQAVVIGTLAVFNFIDLAAKIKELSKIK